MIWGDEAEVRSFEDRWEGGIEHYIGWMKERMLEMHRILKPTGVLFLHCDHHASHYLKVMMDDIFTPRRFQNELVWCYRGGGVPKTAWSRKHDTIFFYSKGDAWHFEPQYVGYSESTRQVTSRTGRRVNQTEIDLERGAHMPDWWTDINSLQTWDRERLGYPTQKPEALLERILTSCSREGDVVLDPFCGCGTAVVVAEKMRRQWVGIDISPTAVNIMHQRLTKATGGAVSVKTVGLPVTEAELRELKPFEFQNWIVQRFNGTHSERRSGDMGIDGWSFMTHDPIQVKQSERVGRNVVDNFETAIERAGKTKGYIVAFSFTSGAVEEAARARRAKGLDIKLVKVSDLIEDPRELRRPDINEIFPRERPRSFMDFPLAPARQKKARPSVEQLVKSDNESVGDLG